MHADAIIAAARSQTGLTDIGDERILEGLHRLVDALNSEAPLTDSGIASNERRITKALANRLRVIDYLKTNPGLAERPVEKPMFVFGLPRTGTTLVINLLNADPSRRCFLRWESMDSVPPPQGDYHVDPRYLAEKAALEQSIQYAPHISAMHHEDADSPTECQFAMMQSFCAQVYEANAEIPSYRAWFLNTSYRPAFDYHKQLLQVLQQHVGGRWTLKNPWHPLFLDDLTAVYPDAQLVMTHRDPADVVGSACSLIKHVRLLQQKTVDLEYIARTMIDIFDRMIAGSDAYRAQHGADSIYDMHYAAVMKDPMAEIRKLYARFDEPLTPAAETAMTAFLADNQKGKHGKHDYTLEEFGLTKAGVRAHFRDYCERYAIPLKD